MTKLTTPPHNDEAERSLLGAIFLDEEALEVARVRLEACDLYRDAHQHVWRAMVALHDRGERVDVISLSDHLHAQGLLEAVGGPSFLAGLSNGVPSAANAEYYAAIVARKAALRRASAELRAAMGAIDAGVQDFHTFADGALTRLTRALELKHRRSELVSAREAAAQALQMVEDACEADGLPGIPSGFADLDALTGGWRDSDLIIIQARPAMGKSLLLGQMAYHAAELGHPVLLFSMEMPARQWSWREAIGRANIPAARVKAGQMNDRDWASFIKALGEVTELPVWIDERAALTIHDIKQTARRAVREHGVELIGVDYFQLTRGEGDRRHERLGDVTRGLKALAKELDVPVIALAQCRREVEQRADKRPGNSDIKESGQAEQDADVIGYVYRDEVYNEDSEDAGIAEVGLTKQRNGELGRARLAWRGGRLRFGDLDGYHGG